MSPDGTNSHWYRNREAKISSQAVETTVPDLLIGGLPGEAWLVNTLVLGQLPLCGDLGVLPWEQTSDCLGVYKSHSEQSFLKPGF